MNAFTPRPVPSSRPRTLLTRRRARLALAITALAAGASAVVGIALRRDRVSSESVIPSAPATKTVSVPVPARDEPVQLLPAAPVALSPAEAWLRDWETRWSQLTGPNTELRSADLVTLLSALAKRDAARAAQRLLDLHPEQRVAVVTESLRQSAERGSDLAVTEAIRFCDLNPEYAPEYGRALVQVLGAKGDFPAALRFVLAEDSDGEVGEDATKWLNTLFTAWGQVAPARAAQAAATLLQPGQREPALQAAVATWIKTDAPAAMHFVEKLRAGPERDSVVESALYSWTMSDPVAAETWLSRR